jgi:hypothetical protein
MVYAPAQFNTPLMAGMEIHPNIMQIARFGL